MSDQPHLGFGTRLAYGFGAVAQGAKSNGFNYLLLFFYSQVVGLPAQWVSFAILIALVFDAVSDPLVGYFSDNLRSPWGRRHPFMYASALPVSLAYYFLWAPPEWSQEALLAYFLVLAIFIRTTITLYDIPSTALVAELTDDYVERSGLWATAISLAGGAGSPWPCWPIWCFFRKRKAACFTPRAGATTACPRLSSCSSPSWSRA